MNFHRVSSPYAPYNMESLINKFTNKHIVFYSLFKVRGLNWNKRQLLKGGVVEKRLRTTALHQILHHTLILVHCCFTNLAVSRTPVCSKSIGYIVIMPSLRRGHRGYVGDASPTRTKKVLTWHLISLKIITKNIFVLHIT